ncbi:DUF488 domain-containing protein [Lysobacter sp. HA18]
METSGTLWTIGHSTHPWEAFVDILQKAEIEAVADVRRFAGSRRHPQFGSDAMAAALPKAGIEYVPFPDLGGRRAARPDSPNTAWRNAAFRGYADYMETPAYERARERLAALATSKRTAVMCAEAVWWQCHRSLISDDFKSRGWTVLHLQAGGRVQEHPYTGAARVVEGRLDYSGDEGIQQGLF